MMTNVLLVILLSIITTCISQVCQNGEIVFLIDQGENAKFAASSSDTPTDTDKFDLLRSALNTALSDQLIATSNTFRIGAFGYSSSDPQTTIIPIGTTPANARNNLGNLLLSSNAGSWTFRGLDMVTTNPAYSNNRLVILSTQGSGSTARRGLALTSYNRVKSLGWNPYVIVLKGKNDVDYEELNFNTGRVDVTLTDPFSSTNPKSYRYLAAELAKVILVLCPGIITTTPTTTSTSKITTTTSTTRPPTPKSSRFCENGEILFIIDQSENAKFAASSSDTPTETDKFDLLRSVLDITFRNQLIATFRIGAFGYSSSDPQTTVIPIGTTPANARNNLGNLLLGSNTGSWTYRGLDMVTSPPTYPNNNRLVILSSQGSGSVPKRELAQTSYNRVKALGWNPYVIVLKGENPVDYEELNFGANAVAANVTDQFNPENPKSYRYLVPELTKLINAMCPTTSYITTTASTATRTTAATTVTVTWCIVLIHLWL